MCTFIRDGRAYSKAANLLHNFDEVLDENPHLDGCFETFRNNWNDTISMVKNQREDVGKVQFEHLYKIFPMAERDPRLFISTVPSLTQTEIEALLKQELDAGNEGLVLYQTATNVYWKVKPVHTIDLRVLRVIPGTGRNFARLGAVLTKYGKVGTGFTDEQRDEFFMNPNFLSSIIEVSYMEMTKNKKMRHARFIRPRPDKSIEDTV